MRILIPFLLATLAALPLRAEIVENDAMKVFEGKWVQSKDPSQNGILMYLTQERSEVGEYFSIRCDAGAPSVRVAFPKRRSGKDLGLIVDGTEMRAPSSFTGRTKDPHFVRGNIFGYKLDFADAAARDAFLTRIGSARMLTIEGQTLPVDLTGAQQAIREQAAYCR
ncbi:hypothetical protein [Pseudooceanicola onchidii]|uniref:hypothetical protein n=1 Tax=Pseudooceanicola onchidii TaxID=2562279 RepID=UPI0010AA7502|nr:hypothetical protein [Pseudooceanicola onchidii]